MKKTTPVRRSVMLEKKEQYFEADNSCVQTADFSFIKICFSPIKTHTKISGNRLKQNLKFK
jgi:hypothetical protein